jgi:hypothetical protein
MWHNIVYVMKRVHSIDNVVKPVKWKMAVVDDSVVVLHKIVDIVHFLVDKMMNEIDMVARNNDVDDVVMAYDVDDELLLLMLMNIDYYIYEMN